MLQEGAPGRAFAVKVAARRLPVFPFSGFDLYHHFRNDAIYDLYNLLKVLKTGKREVVLLQPLPQTLYTEREHEISKDRKQHGRHGGFPPVNASTGVPRS